MTWRFKPALQALKVVAIGVVCVYVLVALAVRLENWRGRHAWEVYQRQREALGDRFDLKSLVPPAVPDAENFAGIPVFAELFPKTPPTPRIAALQLPDCWSRDAHGMPLPPWKSSQQSREKPTDGDWRLARTEDLTGWKKCFTNDDLRAALAVYEPMLQEIRDAFQQRPKCRFPIHYEAGANALLPHLSRLRNVARVCRLRSLVELNAGQSDRALDDIRLSLRLADTIRTEPLLISQLVRCSILETNVQPVWEGLAAHRWNAQQLTALQSEWAKLDQLSALGVALRGERLFGQTYARSMLDHPQELVVPWGAIVGELVSGPRDRITQELICHFCPVSWVYQNLLVLDRVHTETMWPAIDWSRRRIDPVACLKANQKCEEQAEGYPLPTMMLAGLVETARRFAISQVSVDEVVLACALERYRLAKHGLPDTLEALVPAFVSQIPHDVIDGKPLRYRRDGDRFKLWSVGWNGTDEGGWVAIAAAGPWDKGHGDWVWEYPE